jgi:hypothetical protein
VWLLDHNLPAKLQVALTEFGIKSMTTYKCGWAALRNGDLVAEAHKNGFKAILTRDVLFGESAARALVKYPELAVILLKLPQTKANLYIAAFKTKWLKLPILPQAGKFIGWG